MAWGVGANDLANILSTTIGSKSMSVQKAIYIAVIFEVAGAYFGGVHVTNTIRSGIININLFAHDPTVLIQGMLATLLAGMFWMLFASFIGMPVSITNAVVGALVGFGAIMLGLNAIHWHTVGMIALTWILAPCLAALLGFSLFTMIRKVIMASSDPCRNARYYMPIFFFMIGIVLSFMIVLKDLSQFGIHLDYWHRLIVTLAVSLATVLIGLLLCLKLYFDRACYQNRRYAYMEKLFSILMFFTACAMIFAHGSNDIAIAVGPIAAIFSLVRHPGNMVSFQSFPGWILLLGCTGVLSGLIFHGHKVIKTVGQHITSLTPSRAFAATISAATAVILATSAGLPVSATQTLVGGIFGVGAARGIAALNVKVIRNILLSWFITVPVCAGLAVFFFYAVKDIVAILI